MEVLSSPPAPISLSPRASESPLLARRSSCRSVPVLDDTLSLSSSSPTHIFTPVPIPLASSSNLNFVLTPTSSASSSSSMAHGPMPITPSLSPSTSFSPTTATATLRVPRRVKSGIVQGSSSAMGFLPFVPLTPIMASPRLTPDPGANSDGMSAVVHEDRERRGALASVRMDTEACAGQHCLDSEQESNLQSDTRGQRSLDRLITPSWTSTPPTPPQKSAFVFDAGGPGVPYTRVTVGDCQRRHGFDQPRPASIGVFPKGMSNGDPFSSLSTTAHYRAHTSPGADAGHPIGAQQQPKIMKRRQSLPPNFGKPLPPIPHATSRSPSSPLPSQFLNSYDATNSSPTSPRSGSIPRPPNSPSHHLVSGVQTDPVENILLPSLSRVPKKLGLRGTSPLRMGIMAEDANVVENPERLNDRETLPPLHTSDSFGSSYKSALSSPASSPRLLELSPRCSRDGGSGRRLFHLDGDDDDGEEGEEAKLSRESSIQKENEQIRQSVEVPFRSKRYHAILELLTTELGYLTDLKALVSIYLAQLEALSIPIPSPSPSRPSPSSLSISGLARSFPSSRSHISAYSHQPNTAFVLGPPDTSEHGHSRPNSPELGARERVMKSVSRKPILSESEFALVKRNIDDVVAFHERFVSLLKSAVDPFGFGHVLEGNMAFDVNMEGVDEAVKAVAEVFVNETSSFEMYQGFCPGHNEAANLIRNVQDQYPVEWDAFEQRCSLLVAHALESPELPSQYSSESLRKKRRHSTPSLSTPPPLTYVNKSEPIHERTRQRTDGSHSQLGRLKFLDYLIKPVQRICKYPLLLDLLKTKGPRTSVGGSDTIESACAAMRNVCGLVDDASMKQAHSIKSALIVSRIMSSQHEGKPSTLSSEFLTSLGACLIAGALDVVHHTSSSRARYLGGFLYVGGYLVLVKIPKSGKVYEPRYWFSLAGFDVIDVEEDDAAFPYSFHLCGNGHHLQFAAACHHEKEIWLAGIQDAISQPPNWKNEPVSNLPVGEKEKASSVLVEEPQEYNTTPLPTIQSMGELEDHDATAQIPRTYSRPFKTMSRLDGSALRNEQTGSGYVPLSRRSSTASVKAFFAPLTFETSSRISRPSSQVRQQVDHGLHDVFSDSCITVRSQAQMRDGELFQVRKKLHAGMSRSNSGLSISTAMNFATKRRYDSVLVSHKRKNSAENCAMDVTSDPENSAKGTLKISKRPRSFSARRQPRQHISILPPDPQSHTCVEVASPDGLSASPPPFSQPSSASSSNINSALPSPNDEPLPLPTPPGAYQIMTRASDVLQIRREDYKPKRARSMVDNVRYFFHSRSVSPTPSLSGHESPTIVVASMDTELGSPGGLVQWWRRGSLRRRVQSSPENPTEESSSTTPGQSDDSHNTAPHDPPPPPLKPDMDQSQSLPIFAGSPRRVAFTESKPARRRSLFTSSIRREPASPLQSTGSGPLIPRRTLKSVLFQRSHSFTPVDSDNRTP
ncbi:unnamed protein product [Somion occarium]|uniref:DH domain-containing protein n=1 Tax=Somion occarium TaxID=3059160 RepID=A0ABP1CWZ9_9APHY